MSFVERISEAQKSEQAVMDRLIYNGWHSEPFGQAQLSKSCRAHLKRYKDDDGRPTLIRWMPDIITYSESMVALIDAKTGRQDTPNHDIEKKAIEAAGIYSYWLNTPTFFVFNEDMSVLTPDEAWKFGKEGRYFGKGSGTPFVLIEKIHTRSFDDVFPVRS